MGGRVRGGPYRIDGLIDLHDEHPSAFEATLITFGLRWRHAGTPDLLWSDLIALVDHLPWDAPLRRAQPDWQWGDPKYELLVTITEAVHNTWLVNSRKKVRPSDLLRIPRPWAKEKHVTKIGGAPEPIADIDAWLDARIDGQRAGVM